MLEFPQVSKEKYAFYKKFMCIYLLYAIYIYCEYLYVSVSRVWYVYACIHALSMIYVCICFAYVLIDCYPMFFSCLSSC